jgi:hypothetical protein
MDDLFGDVPVVPSTLPPSTPEPADQPPPFTLEGADDLFADVPPVADSLPTVPEATTTTLPPEPPEPVFAFNLEQVGNLFVEVPSATVAAPQADSAVGTFDLEGMIAPPSEAAPGLAAAPAPPFTFAQVGNLFVEMPSEASPTDDARSTENPPDSLPPESELTSAPFTFDQVDDLFLENPSGNALSEPTAPSPPASTAEPSALEQAFASLMGSFDDPAFPSSEEADSQDPEKKKGMS